MVVFETRQSLRLGPPRSRSTSIQPIGSLFHWPGHDLKIRSHADCVMWWRSFYDFHINKRGWSDLAYSMGACQHGHALAGRGRGVRTAANGTNDANYRYHAIQYMGGPADPLTPQGIDALWWCWRALGGGRWGGHRDVRQTSCPGDPIMRGLVAQGPPAQIGNVDDQPETTMFCRNGDKGAAVRLLQYRLNQLLDGRLDVDGIYGPATVKGLAEVVGGDSDGKRFSPYEALVLEKELVRHMTAGEQVEGELLESDGVDVERIEKDVTERLIARLAG